MPLYVCSGAMIKCSMGMSPAILNVLPLKRVMNNGTPQANIMDNKSMVNIQPFGLCRSILNPTVASATAAAWGTLTPMPCIPNTPVPWLPGKLTMMVGNKPALQKSSKLMCIYAGVISINNPGQSSVKDGAVTSFSWKFWGKSFNKSNKKDTARAYGEISVMNFEASSGGFIGNDGENVGAFLDAGAKVSAVEGKAGASFGSQNNPFLDISVKGEALSAKAKAKGFIGKQGSKIGFAGEAGAEANAVKGSYSEKWALPIPFADWSFEYGSTISGSAGSVGATAGAKAYYDEDYKRVYLGVSGGVAAALGLDADIEISIGKKYK